jgi:hypothetical protein
MSESSTTITTRGHLFTIKSFLIPLLTRPRVAQAIKYTVYFSLLVNFFLYLEDDYLGMLSTLTPDAPLMDYLTRFSTSIDMAAWLGLILLFELETYAIPDEAFSRWTSVILRALRAVCYVSIISAAYGYTVESLENYEFVPAEGISNACDVAGQNLWLQLDVVDYVEITTENCAAVSADNSFYQIEGETALLGASQLQHVQWIGLLDISNAFFWLFVVALIEIEVWLQTKDRFSSRLLPVVRMSKTLFYLVLIANGVIWAATGYLLFAWDSFLWIFGFWAIELNLAEWERDRLQELSAEHKVTGAAPQ